MPQIEGVSMRAIVLTGRGLAATDHVDIDQAERPNPFGLVRPRCLACQRLLADCTCWDDYQPPDGTR